MARRTRKVNTLDELASRRRYRQLLEQRWESVIAQAAALHGLEYTVEGWPALTAWYATIPTSLLTITEQDRWLAAQRVSASLTRTA